MKRELLAKPFEPDQIKQRTGLWGDILDYVEAHAYIDRLNQVFDYAWAFEIVEHRVYEDEVVVLGKLAADSIEKSQFGRSKITRARDNGKILSLGDDLKAAATDSLKKCASLFGIGLHLYREDVPQSRGTSRERVAPAGDGNRLTARQLSAIYAIGKSRGLSTRGIDELTQEIFGKPAPDLLTKGEASVIIQQLQELANGERQL